MLLARIVSYKTVQSFQGALQQFLCSQAVLEVPNWQGLLSPRWPIQQHPLRAIGYYIDNDRRAPLRPVGALPKPHSLACVPVFRCVLCSSVMNRMLRFIITWSGNVIIDIV